MTARRPDHLLICNTSDGLVAQINGVFIQLQLARRMGMTPIVYLHKRSYMFGGPNPYFDATNGPNVWDYYFEPIGPQGADLQKLVAEGRVATLSTGSELIRLFRWEPESWFMNPYGYFRSVENRADGPYPAAWWSAERDKARALLNDGTVRFRPALLDMADRYVARHFSEETLGLQLRGSDKFDFGVGPNLSRKITPEEYVPHIDRYLADHPACRKIFVATDQRQWLKDLEKAYPDHIISYSEKSLADGNENRFHEAADKAARGTEVIMDLLILSRCSHVFKCHAAVGEMALTLSPALTFRDLNYDNQPMVARRSALSALTVPLIRAAASLWHGFAESGRALEVVRAVEGDEITLAGGRSINIKTAANDKAPRAPFLSRRFFSDAFDFALRKLSAASYSYSERPR